MVLSPRISPWKKATTFPEMIEIESIRSSHQMVLDGCRDDFGSLGEYPGSTSGMLRVAHLAKGFENEI